MKRSPLKRSTPLRRKVAVRKFNHKRLAKRREAQFGEQAAWCRELVCEVHKVRPWVECFWMRSEPHHEPPRSRGGRDRDCVALCSLHHRERHDIGEKAFNEKYRINLREIAAALHEQIKRSKQDGNGREVSE